jgi:hypothetical protein
MSKYSSKLKGPNLAELGKKQKSVVFADPISTTNKTSAKQEIIQNNVFRTMAQNEED